MILGFAHLAINTADLAKTEEAWQHKGYTRSALHTHVPNHSSKAVFCHRHQPEHDLMLLNGSSRWPLELTCHGATKGENKQISWSQNAIQLTLADPQPLRVLLLKGLGFVEEENLLKLDSRLPRWSCRLELKAGDSDPIRLDADGPTCLAFYCNRIEEDAQRLIQLGASDYSGVFDLTLGERHMHIAMMRVPGGPLLELISPRTRSS